MNLPNKLTIIRVMMIPLYLIFMLIPQIPYGRIVAGIIFTVAAVTDALDGYIARKNNLITNFGKFMDPLADKILVCSALICFVDLGLMPGWIAIIIIAREFIVSGFRLIASDNGIVLAAGWWGKIKTIVQIIMSVMLTVDLDFEFINILEVIFVYLALALTIISMMDYLIKNRSLLFTNTNK
ncbi:CDP-diacylglycerol--glycerol-3-phosphate 3-phosphatidyltransferase [Herbinix hemicellulosilytica]|uniref:CDP-diacylglycerol--glycerol-3-phosphate 3-phosphatidyltransferase n=1 Tax=Herbinix hemicellulosilytica TaxID=1564487 RepID=A0A0H5SHM7_HERHM|nr:CDP-diacylglycerol--glycerol-3-phosphate 3-phosphatidyltransferase [Herbinix hemicellulosilytica]RBP60624.1 CDP-diacylglycerol--glycerol-3-phosphate 3-phosphatidyltransferase [Herbinix hemicellulosilytica]CRZ34311.1 putative membrane protein [Herbinix hemicellulosilytica]